MALNQVSGWFHLQIKQLSSASEVFMHASHFITQIIKKTDSQELRYGNTSDSYFFITITFKVDFFNRECMTMNTSMATGKFGATVSMCA